MPKVTGGSVAAHRRATRQAIFDAFSALLYERGYDSLTLAEIAAEAGMSRTSIYNYLTSKDALVVGADLAALLGATWRDLVQPNAGTVAYVARLDEVCASWPGGYVAHHYVRYLGDLSGGQLIRRIVQRHYGLSGEHGTSSYLFPGIGNLVTFKNRYRHLLDIAPWDAAEKEAVDEVVRAFRLNADVLNALPVAA